MCIGAVPRVVKVEAGFIVVDGVVKSSLREANIAAAEGDAQSGLPNKKKRCGRCQRNGHNRATCNIKNEITAAYDQAAIDYSYGIVSN